MRHKLENMYSTRASYRVSHIEMFLLNWLGQIEIYKLDFFWRYLCIPEVMAFEFHPPVLKKLFFDRIMKTHVEFSVGGFWGQPMLLFWKLVDETQMPWPQEYTDTFKQNLTCIFLSVRVNSKETFQCETPCRSKLVCF